jgi:hypothetical protein
VTSIWLYTFVADYNRTGLRCLGYQAPAELLAKLAGHNSKAGVKGAGRLLLQLLLPGVRFG